MENRLTINELFESILGNDHVYAQTPESIKMDYPAIKYSLSNLKVDFANNSPYSTRSRYTVTLIDYDIDSVYVDELLKLPYCSLDRYYTSNGLHHWSFTIYF